MSNKQVPVRNFTLKSVLRSNRRAGKQTAKEQHKFIVDEFASLEHRIAAWNSERVRKAKALLAVSIAAAFCGDIPVHQYIHNQIGAPVTSLRDPTPVRWSAP